MRWQPARPRLPIKVVECGRGKWDEQDHGLDYPGPLHTIDFRVTGRGHERIETLFQDGCAERGRKFSPYSEKQPEQRIGHVDLLQCLVLRFVRHQGPSNGDRFRARR
jgi:hypothetical protein